MTQTYQEESNLISLQGYINDRQQDILDKDWDSGVDHISILQDILNEYLTKGGENT